MIDNYSQSTVVPEEQSTPQPPIKDDEQDLKKVLDVEVLDI